MVDGRALLLSRRHGEREFSGSCFSDAAGMRPDEPSSALSTDLQKPEACKHVKIGSKASTAQEKSGYHLTNVSKRCDHMRALFYFPLEKGKPNCSRRV
ncbi:hypothetical protein GN956_G783 [Arapaima gigas]